MESHAFPRNISYGIRSNFRVRLARKKCSVRMRCHWLFRRVVDISEQMTMYHNVAEIVGTGCRDLRHPYDAASEPMQVVLDNGDVVGKPVDDC